MIAGTVANFDSSTINRSGSIIKDRNLVNAGRMNSLCGGDQLPSLPVVPNPSTID